MLEDAAYRRMLDVVYATEKALPRDQQKIYRLVRARSHAEQLAVDVVLGEFWTEKADGWHNARADEELTKAHAKSDAARASAAQRWQSGRNANASANAMRTHSEGNAPNNQEPKTKGVERSRGSRLQLDTLPEDWRAFCASERADLDPAETFKRFKDYWIAQPGRSGSKVDWLATWRNWVRNEKRVAGAAEQRQAPSVVQLGNCPCGAQAALKVGNQPRCEQHAKGFQAAA